MNIYHLFGHFRILANVISTAIIFINKATFIAYPFVKSDASSLGTQKSYQRHEQCITFLSSTMGPALEALFAEKYFDKNTQDAAIELSMQAVADILDKVQNTTRIKDELVREKVFEKLKAMKLVIMFPKEFLNIEETEKFFDELHVGGSESLVELQMEIQKNSWKLFIQRKESRLKFLGKMSGHTRIKYFLDENVLRKCFYKIGNEY